MTKKCQCFVLADETGKTEKCVLRDGADSRGEAGSRVARRCVYSPRFGERSVPVEGSLAASPGKVSRDRDGTRFPQRLPEEGFSYYTIRKKLEE